MEGKRILVVEDGPTLTHGEMTYGAAHVAARLFGAASIVDPRPYAVGSIKDTFARYGHLTDVLPAMGYGDAQMAELEQTIRAVDCDLVLIGTPIDLGRLLKIDKPAMRVGYELDQAAKNRIKTQVMDGLNALNNVELPNALVEEEIDRLRQQAGASMGQVDPSQLPDQLFEEEARRRVALGLIIGELVRQHDLKLDRDRVEAALQEVASTYEDPQQVVSYYRSNPQAMANVEAMVLEEQVVDWVLEKAKVSDEQTDFDSLMNPGKGAEQA